MSVNKYFKHLIVLPEDSANRQIANGFSIVCPTRQLKVENEVGGWMKVVEHLNTELVGTMRMYPDRYVVLVIDFDEDADRLNEVRRSIPVDVSDRVFVLGCLKEPEDLKRAGLGSFEEIGQKLAKACIGDIEENIWCHALLSNNDAELERFREVACKILL